MNLQGNATTVAVTLNLIGSKSKCKISGKQVIERLSNLNKKKIPSFFCLLWPRRVRKLFTNKMSTNTMSCLTSHRWFVHCQCGSSTPNAVQIRSQNTTCCLARGSRHGVFIIPFPLTANHGKHENYINWMPISRYCVHDITELLL